MRIRIIVIIISFALLSVENHSFGQTKLNELISYALDHSRDIKNADLKLEEIKYQQKEVLGKGLPQAEATGSYSRMNLPKIEISDEMVQMIPQETAPLLGQLGGLDALYMASAGIQVTQLIYSRSYWEGLKTTKKAEELYELLKNKTEDEVIEEVAKNYYQALSLQLSLSTVEKSLENLKELYRIVNLNYQNDLVKESDVNRLKVNMTNLEVNQQMIKNGIDIQLKYIKAIAGMPQDTVIGLDTTIVGNYESEMIENPGFELENVPSYQVLLKQKELNDQQIQVEQAVYGPTLAAYGKLDFSSFNTSAEMKQMHNMNTFGVQLNMPVFSSGVNRAKVQQARLKRAQTDETILKTKDLLSVSYSNALTQYQTSYQLLEVQKENRDLANKVYYQTSLLYKEGMASMADVLNVNSEFLQAENSFYQQIIKCKLSEIEILKSSGYLEQLVNIN